MRRVHSFAQLLFLVVAATAVAASGCSLVVTYDDIPSGGQGGTAVNSVGGGSVGGGSVATSSGQGGGGQGGGGATPDCVAPSDCPSFPDDNLCRTTTCDVGKCGVSSFPVNTPVGTQTAADCLVNACDANGDVVSQPDNADVADDGNDCTDNTCDNGVPQHPSKMPGTPCGAANDLTCDGNGACTGCTLDSQCNADTDCQNHSCNVPQGECQVILAINGTACTSDNQFCTGVEVCQGGSCQSPGDPCAGPDNDNDCSETCDGIAAACTGNDPNGSNCDDGSYCNGADTCNNGTCSHAGSPCAGVDGDGNCAESCDDNANNCSANDPNGAACLDDGQFCNGTETCQNGSCVGAGNPCVGADGDSDCSESCDNTNSN